MNQVVNTYLLVIGWVMTLNPDPIAKWLGAIASVFVIISSIYSIKKNRQK